MPPGESLRSTDPAKFDFWKVGESLLQRRRGKSGKILDESLRQSNRGCAIKSRASSALFRRANPSPEAKVPTIIPTFLLKKLYIKGSFKNTPNGFELALKNTLAPGTIIGLSPLQIDGRNVPLDKILIASGAAAPVRASDISLDTPRAFPLNVVVKFQVEDQPLAPGSHRVTVQVNTKEAGELKIDAEDSIE
jgi:hypothetical protein